MGFMRVNTEKLIMARSWLGRLATRTENQSGGGVGRSERDGTIIADHLVILIVLAFLLATLYLVPLLRTRLNADSAQERTTSERRRRAMISAVQNTINASLGGKSLVVRGTAYAPMAACLSSVA